MQFNHQPITAIDLNFLHGAADTALLLLQVVANYAECCAPGFTSFASCADRALLWWGACSPLLTEQFSAYLPGQWASQLEGGKCSEQSFVQYSAAQLHHSAHRASGRKQGGWIGWSDGQPVCRSVGWLVLAPL